MDPFIYLIFIPFLILIIALNKVKAHFFWIFNRILTILCSLTLFLSGIFVLFASTSLFISILLILAGLLILLLLHEKFRENLIKIGHLNIESENPRHYFALLLFFCILFAAIISFLWMTETGETIFKTEINAQFNIMDVVINEIFYLAIAIFGYGYLTRRNLKETLNSLGVKKLNFSGIVFGFIAGIGLIFLVIIFSLIFQHFGLEEENTDWLKNLISVQNAFIIGLSAGICEEILFRGALQPKFGIILTALLFTSLHMQYPALWMLFIIFTIGVILGYVRKMTNTTTAIIVHSTYNTVQMLMLCF
ncbi:MAG: hypothetical protein CVT88_04770, partial [Candidatus Altiarchaeales archaeon HGW-Altiarchaeales-1]